MTLTVMRKPLKKIINYRCFKEIPIKTFRETLINSLFSEEVFNNDKRLQRFCNNVCLKTVNNFALIKRK